MVHQLSSNNIKQCRFNCSFVKQRYCLFEQHSDLEAAMLVVENHLTPVILLFGQERDLIPVFLVHMWNTRSTSENS